MFFAALYGFVENKTKNQKTVDLEVENKNTEITTPEESIRKNKLVKRQEDSDKKEHEEDIDGDRE